MSEKRFVTLLIVGALIVLTAIVLGVRPNTPPIQPFGSALKTMPASRHVTGMPYPKLCTLTVSNGHALPDHGCTPGAADGEVIVPALGNPGNLAGTICTPGWTKAAAALDGELVPVKAAADAAYNMRGQQQAPPGGAGLACARLARGQQRCLELVPALGLGHEREGERGRDLEQGRLRRNGGARGRSDRDGDQLDHRAEPARDRRIVNRGQRENLKNRLAQLSDADLFDVACSVVDADDDDIHTMIDQL